MRHSWWALAVAVAMAAAPVHAEMYKCVDESGVTQYTDKPTPGCKGGPTDIRPQPPISGKDALRSQDVKGQEQEFRSRQVERAEQEQKEARALDERKRRCSKLQAEYQTYNSGRRLSSLNEKGERTYLEEADRERRIAQLKAEIDRDCRF